MDILDENEMSSYHRFFDHPSISKGAGPTPPKNAVCAGQRNFTYDWQLDNSMKFRIKSDEFDKMFSQDIGTLKQPDTKLMGAAAGCKTSVPSTFFDLEQVPTSEGYLDRWRGKAEHTPSAGLRKCSTNCSSKQQHVRDEMEIG